ncbi:MAG TPA: M48 family metallopeptidase [Thermoanaerobaculia bacterium]|nr:M48 family metallopeptidase [Thermoanaerobaculia bacterium]
MNRSQFRIKKVAAALSLSLLMVPALAEAQTKVKSGYNMFSPEQDVEIGRQSASEANRQLPTVRDGSVNDFVNEIGQRLAANAPGPKFRYEFRVVDASDLNAFALPGGFLYINRGIIEAAKNEGEVAGVLAHEISHAALRHGTANASKQYLTQAGIGILGGILGGKMGQNTGQIVNAVGGFGLNALFLKYSRQAETDADITGAQIMARSGYNPADMASFFDTLAKTDKRRTANWLSSHPAPENRRDRIYKESTILGITPTAGATTSRHEAVKAELRRMGPAQTMEQIATRGPAPRSTPQRRSSSQQQVRVEPPSRDLRSFTATSRVYQVGYPSNWEVYEQGDTGATFAPRGGVGNLDGRTEIVYGAIVNHYEPFGNAQRRNNLYGGGSSRRGNGSITEATDDLLSQLMQSSPHLKMVRNSGTSVRISGEQGLAAVLRGNNPGTGITERVTVVTSQLDDAHLIYLLFITPEEEAERYSPVLNAMVQTLKIDPDHRH